MSISEEGGTGTPGQGQGLSGEVTCEVGVEGVGREGCSTESDARSRGQGGVPRRRNGLARLP